MRDAEFAGRFLAILFRPEGCTCDFSGEDDSLCDWCEDAPRRELIEAQAEGDPPELDELEDELWVT